jgi:hypothetical protein
VCVAGAFGAPGGADAAPRANIDAVARRLAVGVILGAIVLLGVAPAARAGDDAPASTAPPTLPIRPDDAGHIVKRPNYGQAPEGPNDRGGWQQLLVFGLVCVGVSGVAAFAWRDARRRRKRTPTIAH